MPGVSKCLTRAAVPSVIHWNISHFAAIIGRNGDRYHLLDPTFETHDIWLTQLGHEVDVDINTYTLTSVELRQAAVNRLESFVGAKQCSNGAQEIRDARNLLN